MREKGGKKVRCIWGEQRCGRVVVIGRMTPVTPGKFNLDHGDDLHVSGLEVMSVKSNRN